MRTRPGDGGLARRASGRFLKINVAGSHHLVVQREELQSIQRPLKKQYAADSEAALVPTGPWLEHVRSLRPNAAMAEKQALCQIGHLEAGDPESLGAHMGALAQRLPRIDVWGGCCGTWDDHLHAIAQQLRPLEGIV